MDYIIDLIKQAWQWLKNVATRIIRGILSFWRDVVSWFKNLPLIKGRHIPFLFNGNHTQLKKMIKNAPVRDCNIFSANEQIVKGVLDEATDEIIHCEIIGADELDHETERILGNEPIVVLS